MGERRVHVLRLGHRIARDKRATTHLLLAARALGADGVFYTGQRDEKVEDSVKKVNETWGGPFEVGYTRNWGRMMKDWKERGGEVVHLTMYGLPLRDVIEQIRGSPKDKLVVVGGPKVQGVVYGLADWNVSVTSQPHSEISALSIFLHEFFQGWELSKTFKGAKMKVVPQSKGKKVVRMET